MQRERWAAALQVGDLYSVEHYYKLYTLGFYAGAARKWLSDYAFQSPKNLIKTQISAAQPEIAWEKAINSAANQSMRLTRVTGELALTRSYSAPVSERHLQIKKELEDTVTNSGESEPKNLAKLTAEILSNHGNAVALAPKGLDIRSSPSSNAQIIDQVKYMQNIKIVGHEVAEDGKTWSKVIGNKKDDQPGFVIIPEPKIYNNIDIGYPLEEFFIPVQIDNSGERINNDEIQQVLSSLKKSGMNIKWVSISTPRTDNKRHAAIFYSYASETFLALIREGIARGIITIFEGADFVEDRIRIRIFGKALD